MPAAGCLGGGRNGGRFLAISHEGFTGYCIRNGYRLLSNCLPKLLVSRRSCSQAPRSEHTNAVQVWGTYTKAGYEHGDLVRLKMDLILGRSHDSRCPEYEDQRGWQCLMRSGFGELKPIFRALFSVFTPQAVRVPPDPCLSFTSVPTKI